MLSRPDSSTRRTASRSCAPRSGADIVTSAGAESFTGRYYRHTKRSPLPHRPWTITRVVRGLARRGPSAFVDLVAVAGSYLIAFGVRTGARLELFDPTGAVLLALGAGVLQVCFNVLFDIYWRNWSLAALEDLIALTKSTVVVVLALLAFTWASDNHFIPVSAVLAGGAIVLVVESAIKLRPRWPQILRA